MPNSSQILFEILKKETYKDNSYNAYIRFRRPCNVGTFIKEWMLDDKQHGVIVIKDSKFRIKFSNGNTEPLPKYALKYKIKNAYGKRIDGDSIITLTIDNVKENHEN